MSGMSRRRFVGRSAAVLGGLLAAACNLDFGRTPQSSEAGSPTVGRDPSQAGSPAQAKKPLKVLILDGSGLSSHPVVAEIGRQFANHHPSLTLEWLDLPAFPNDPRRLREWTSDLAASGDLAGLLHTTPVALASLLDQGGLLGLNRFARRDRYDLRDYWPGSLEANRWRGELYGLPTQVTPSLLYCNQVLFDGAGVALPSLEWDWEDLLDAARKLTDRRLTPPILGFAPGFPGIHSSILPWVWSNGGAMFRTDPMESTVAEQQSQAALQWLADLSLKHKVSPVPEQVGKPEQVSRFVEVQIAMLLFPWLPGRFITSPNGKSPEFPYAIVEPPQGVAGPATWLSQDGYFIGGATDDPDAAWIFLSWWTSQDRQRWFQSKTSKSSFARPPARRSVADEFVGQYGTATVAALSYARQVPLHPDSWNLLQVYDRVLLPMWRGEQSVAAATTEVAKQQNAILAA